MARFDVYENPNGTGFILDLQADLLEQLNTRIVAPLLPFVEAPPPAKRLNPVFEINNSNYVLAIQFMAAIPVSDRGKLVTSLKEHDVEISNALDLVFYGF